MCGTDIKLIHRTFKGFPESVYPIMLGHEGVGEVVEVGAKVKGFKVGDKVLLPFVDPDPENLPGLGSGWGALSEYAVVCDPEAPWPDGAPDCAFAQTVLDDDLDPVDATMIVTFGRCSPTSATSASPPTTRGGVRLRARGPDLSEVYEPAGRKEPGGLRHPARKAGPGQGLRRHLPHQQQGAGCGRRGAQALPRGRGLRAGRRRRARHRHPGMALIKDRGSVLCYGVPEKEEVTIDFSKADYNWRVIYQQMPRKREEGAAHTQVVEWMRSGQLNIKDFISDYFTFDQSVEAYDKLLAHKIMKKGIITF